ncbi:MAG: hypothetical protein DRO00_01165 [Thermoproteota archaeon]|nr:MAG: hypothetical protein DRO00_01165 [Candidatus Korarchaeota archaeon]
MPEQEKLGLCYDIDLDITDIEPSPWIDVIELASGELQIKIETDNYDTISLTITKNQAFQLLNQLKRKLNRGKQ